jgi:hypothetical protein
VHRLGQPQCDLDVVDRCRCACTPRPCAARHQVVRRPIQLGRRPRRGYRHHRDLCCRGHRGHFLVGGNASLQQRNAALPTTTMHVDGDYYEVLGVARTATADELKRVSVRAGEGGG